MSLIPTKRLGDVLIECKLISEEDLKNALKVQAENKQRLGETLIKLGLVTEDDIIWAIGNQLNISYVNLTEDMIDKALAQTISPSLARKYKFVPVLKLDNELTIVMSDPLDAEAVEAIKENTKCELNISVSRLQQINKMIEKLYGKAPVGEEGDESFSNSNGNSELAQGINLMSPDEIIQALIMEAVLNKADDIFFKPEKHYVYITIVREKAVKLKLQLEIFNFNNFIQHIVKIAKFDNNLMRKEHMSAHVVIDMEAKEYDVRISTLPTINGISLRIAILRESYYVRKLEQFYFNEDQKKTIIQTLNKPNGMIFVNGPLGSAKEAIRYSLLKTFNPFTERIFTIEDPVIYNFRDFYQIQIKDIDKYASKLDSVLKHNPTIIMIDHIHKKETLEMTLHAAFKQCKMIASMMVVDAINTIPTILRMGISKPLFAAVTDLIIAQRLVNELCPHCKKEYNPNPKLLQYLKAPEDFKYFSKVGCIKCENTGYAKKEPIFEILKVNQPMKKAIVAGSTIPEIMQIAKKSGFKSFKQIYLELVAKGLVDVAEITQFFM